MASKETKTTWRFLAPHHMENSQTCQLRPPTPSQRRLSRGAQAPALTVSEDETRHLNSLLARAVPDKVVVGPGL